MEKVWYKSYPEGMPKEIDPEGYHSLVDMFESSCLTYSEHKAATNLGTSLTYRELEKKTREFAAYLQKVLRLKKGDRIAIMLPNTLQFYIALFGSLRAGLVVVNINPLYTKRELVHQLRDARVSTIVVVANFAHTVEASLEHVSIKNIILTQLGDMCGFPKKQLVNFVVKYIKKMVPAYSLPHAIPFNEVLSEGSAHEFTPVELVNSDTAFLQYTGGTTGIAKGAVLTHGNIVANVLQILTWTDNLLHLGREVMILPLPLYHIFSLTCGCFVMLASGAETVLITNPRDIPNFIKELEAVEFTVMLSINTLSNALLNNPKFSKIDFSRFKFCIVGGMAATEPVARKWKAVTGIHLLEGYGLTETSPVVTINSFHGTEFTGGIGYPIPGTDICIVDDKGKPVPTGEIGELCVKGPQVMKGYWENPEETEKSFTEDGWFLTGDMASIDDTGLVKLVDRKKDMIIVSGFNVYPTEIEEILMSHSKVLEAAVIGIPNADNTGEMVKAFVVRKEKDLTAEGLIAYCKKYLTNYKVPHVVEFRDSIPKTPVGKILRRELREEIEAAAE